MLLLCPNCEKEQEVTLIKKDFVIKIKGRDIVVPIEGYICNVCGEFIAPPDTDELEEAYKIYEDTYGEDPRYHGKRRKL
jgi:YgiT-type zinc finger domain-containing protein